MCALGVSEPGNELVRKVDQNGPNTTSLLAPSAAWSNATPETPRYTWPAPDAEPFASRSTFPQASGSNGHVAENHPGCALCWRCVTEAQECPICGLEGPLLEDDDFEREWAQAAQ